MLVSHLKFNHMEEKLKFDGETKSLSKMENEDN